MIPIKVDSSLPTTIGKNSTESIVEWFDQHKQSFYILGGSYLPNQQMMEELFYRSIVKVHKELPRFNNETSFDRWVTSIFINICRDLSHNRSLPDSEERESRSDILKSLNQLNQTEREAILLTYVKEFGNKEVAWLLQISVDKVKELLFSGIQSLRKEMGYDSAFRGCNEYHKYYIDYLEREMDRSKKIEFEKHIYHCQNCQEDLATFRDVMFSMLNLTEVVEDFHVPSDFMENIKVRLAEIQKRKQQKNKKRKQFGLILGSLLTIIMAIGFFTGVFSELYYTWTEDDQELLAFLQQDLGDRLNLEAESNGVIIRIKGAVADEVQTLVFYEIEDTKKDNQYMMDFHNGVFVTNDYEILNRETFPRYYPPNLDSEINKESKNVYQGKLSLLPLSKDSATIKLNITKVQKLIRESFEQNNFGAYGNLEYETGEWNFEIPVTKQPSIEYALDQETKVEGIPVYFEKLKMAPTATILQYTLKSEQLEKRIEGLNFSHLEVNNKKVKADRYGSTFLHGNMINMTFQTYFDSIYGEKPKKINVQFENVFLTFNEQKTVILDASKEYPQTFEYAGSTISIDRVEIGQPSKVVISNHEIKNRAYQSLHFNIIGEGDNGVGSMEMDSEGVIVDKNGKVYDMNEIPVAYEEIEQPRHFDTVQRIGLHSDVAGESIIPNRLEIYGYNAIKYLDDVVKISLKE
jgi:RNA polymerase sigma factor (sigma-70 family)